jgi:hypothetical protein
LESPFDQATIITMKSSALDRVRESNRQADDAWQRWTLHREHVMDLLVRASSDEGQSLCLLGAGHLNDVRLDALQARYGSITLVDVDVETVAAALPRRLAANTQRCHVYQVDLTGILDQLAHVQSRGLTTSELLAGLGRHHCRVPGEPFDVAVSLGVLTQMLQTVVDAKLEGDDLARVSIALRDKHLRDLMHLTRPGGSFVLVTDVVSTTTAPAVLAIPPEDLEPEMARLVAARNFFTGTNPYRIVALLEEHESFRTLIARVRLMPPWLWAVVKGRQHLTCAIVAQRSLN